MFHQAIGSGLRYLSSWTLAVNFVGARCSFSTLLEITLRVCAALVPTRDTGVTCVGFCVFFSIFLFIFFFRQDCPKERRWNLNRKRENEEKCERKPVFFFNRFAPASSSEGR